MKITLMMLLFSTLVSAQLYDTLPPPPSWMDKMMSPMQDKWRLDGWSIKGYDTMYVERPAKPKDIPLQWLFDYQDSCRVEKTEVTFQGFVEFCRRRMK